MVYADPVAMAFASGDFYEHLGVPYYLSAEKLAGDYAPVRFERELRLLRRYVPGGAVLDVGCSTGAFLFHLKTGVGAGLPAASDAYAVAGVDVVSDALDYAESRGIEVIRAPFLEHDFGARRFDAVTFWAVLEHLAEPRRFLEKAAALMRSGGFCFVLVPNLNSLAVRFLGKKYRYVMPEHLNYFTHTTLQTLDTTTNAFKVVAVLSLHFNPVVIWQDWRRGGAPVAEAERARLLRRTVALKQRRSLRPLKLLYGGVETLLGALRLADNLALVLRKR